MKTYILGAGVSRGYVRGAVFPPTMVEFFKVAGVLNWAAETDMCHGLWANLVKAKGLKSERAIWKTSLNIEDLMCELYDQALEDGNWELYLQLEYFIKSILLRTTDGPSWEPMDQFVRALDGGSGLITFNYDCLLEKSLIKADWRHAAGYRMMFQGRFVDRNGKDFLTPRVGGGVGSWDYLKLHGSLNWLVDRNIRANYLGSTGQLTSQQSLNAYLLDTLRSESADYPMTNMSGKLENEKEDDLFSLIIPPSRKKEYSEYRAVLGFLWELAKKKISESDELVFIGFSLPRTDENIQVLFTGFQGKRVVVINRSADSELRARYRALFPDAVIDFQEMTFAEYAAMLPPSPPKVSPSIPDFDCPIGISDGLMARVEVSPKNDFSDVSVDGQLNGHQISVRFHFDHGEFIRERFAQYAVLQIPSFRLGAMAETVASISRSMPCLDVRPGEISRYELGNSYGPQFTLTLDIEWRGSEMKLNLADFVPKALNEFRRSIEAATESAERRRIAEAPEQLGIKPLI